MKYETSTIISGVSIVFILLALISWAGFAEQSSLWPDEALYMMMGQSLASDPSAITDVSGQVFYKNPPLFMYLLAVLFIITGGGSLFSAHLFVMLLGAGAIIVSYLIAARMYGKHAGLLAAALLAVSPLHFWISTRVLIDVPLTLLVYLAIYFLMCGNKAKFYLTSFFAVITKYPAALLFLLPTSISIVKQSGRAFWVLYGLGVAGIVAFILFKGHLHLASEGVGYFLRAIKWPDVSEILRERYFFDVFLLAFCLLGFGVSIKQKQFSPLLIWFVVFGTARFFLPWEAFRASRYSLPLLPAMVIFSAYGMYWILDGLRNRFSDNTRAVSVIFIAIVVFLLSTNYMRAISVTSVNNKSFVGYELPVAFLRAQQVKSILTGSPRQMKYFLPDVAVFDFAMGMSPEEVGNLIEARGIQAIVLDRWSPHLPPWALKYFRNNKAYIQRFGDKNFAVFFQSKG